MSRTAMSAPAPATFQRQAGDEQIAISLSRASGRSTDEIKQALVAEFRAEQSEVGIKVEHPDRMAPGTLMGRYREHVPSIEDAARLQVETPCTPAITSTPASPTIQRKQNMTDSRIARRTIVSLEGMVATIVDTQTGTITDLSETGAKVSFRGAMAGEKVAIMALEQDVFGTVAWTEGDRFGMRFYQELTEGPLFDYLVRMRAKQAPSPSQLPTSHPMRVRQFGRRQP